MLDTRITTATNAVRLSAAELNDALSRLADEVALSWRQERSIVLARRRLSLLYRTISSIERDIFSEEEDL